MSTNNRLASLVLRIQKAGLPPKFEQFALTSLFNFQVKLAGTAGIWIESLSNSESTVTLASRRRVQNHIGGIHACGMALLAESATGMVFGMNVPDTHTPLIKSMKIEYKRRAQGDLKAVASLGAGQIESIQSCDRGEINIQVNVTDEKEEGPSPIACEMIWAWVPKAGKSKA